MGSTPWSAAQQIAAATEHNALETASWLAGIGSLAVAVYAVLATRSAQRRHRGPGPRGPDVWPERRIARVHPTGDKAGATAGLAFAVGPDLVVTCAHVVNLALGRSRTDPSQPSAAEVDLEFPIAGAHEHGTPRRRATLVAWSPRQGRFALTDLAVLRMRTPLAGAAGLSLAAEDPRGPVQFWGPTAQHPDGGHVTGRLPGAADSGRLQIESDVHHPLRAVYSGGPVWRPRDGTVVGLLQVTEDDAGVSVHVLPSELVRATIAQLDPGPADDPAPDRLVPAGKRAVPNSPRISRRTALTTAGLLAATAGGLGYAWRHWLRDDWPPDWPTGPHDYGAQAYLPSGGYQLTVSTPGHALRARAPVSLDRRGVRMAATAQAPENAVAWGLWCGDADGRIHAEFGVHPDGMGYINVQGRPAPDPEPPPPGESLPQFRAGEDNHLEAECVVDGDALRMTLAINGVPAVRRREPLSTLGAITVGVYGALRADGNAGPARIRYRGFELAEVG